MSAKKAFSQNRPRRVVVVKRLQNQSDTTFV